MDRIRITPRYSNVAIALHWLIAFAILANLATGFTMEGYSPYWRRFTLDLHMSTGVSIFVLSLLRLAWRLSHRPPPMVRMAAWERRLALTVHFLLYLLMLVMPLLGWVIISANRNSLQRTLMIFDLIPFPPIDRVAHLAAPSKLAVHDQFVDFHLTGACILAALLAGHIAGALKHQFFDRQAELQRMGIVWLKQ